MNKFKWSIAAAMCALSGYAAISAHAEVLNLPASAAFMNGDYLNSNCSVTNDPLGINAGNFGGICDLQFPVEIPVGRMIQQIEVISSSSPLSVLPFINVYLSTLDYSTSATTTRFPWTSNLPPGVLKATRLMQQTKGGAYLEAFVVQPSTLYQVVVHIEDGASATGLKITYQ